jgi:hypothetical protein
MTKTAFKRREYNTTVGVYCQTNARTERLNAELYLPASGNANNLGWIRIRLKVKTYGQS